MILGTNKETQLRLHPDRILVRRDGALGDVILTTPVIQRLREVHPVSTIIVSTYYPEVFLRNKAVNFATTPDKADELAGFDMVYDLNLVYECNPSVHIVHAYMQHVFDDSGDEWNLQQQLYPFSSKVNFLEHDRYVVVNPTYAGWANRTLPRRTWVDLCQLLQRNGYQPIVAGTSRDMNDVNVDATTFSVADIHAHLQLYSQAACFVGSDSALLHVAGATEVPIVGVFTSVRPQYRLPIRHGIPGYRCEAVVPYLPCVGCHERRPVPSIAEHCERGDLACVKAVTARDIYQAIVRLLG